MVEVIVSRLGMDPASQTYVVVLQEKNGTRLVPIWIGQPEADSSMAAMIKRYFTEIASDRKRLSYNGIVSVAIAMNDKGMMLANPEIELIGI